MAFEAAREAGTFLSEYGKQKDDIELATLNSVQRLIERGELQADHAEGFFAVMLLHARTNALRLWEAFDTPEAPPVPSHLF